MESSGFSWNGSNGTDIDCAIGYDSMQYKVLAIVRACVGLLSFLACLGVVVIIFAFKKYRVFIQRLVLYLAIAAMIHSISYCTARVNFYTVRPILDPYCYFGGLFNHYTAAVELISVWCIMISLFIKALFSRNTQKLEVVYVLATFLGPSLWFWVPLWQQSYGTAGGWCGLRVLNEDCSAYEEGSIIGFGIWYVPLYIFLSLIFIGMILVAIKAIRDVYKWRGHFDPNERQNREAIRNEIKLLIWYPIIYLLFNSFSLISQIYTAVHPEEPSIFLIYLRVISSPLRGAVIALVYTLDKETRRRLRPSHIRSICQECCCGDSVKEYDTLEGITDSYNVNTPAYVQYGKQNAERDQLNSTHELIGKVN